MLIITYYWPPSGGPGVQRVLKFVKYLPQFGWEPIVLTVENGEYPAIDESLLKDIDPGLKVYKSKTTEYFNLFRKFSGVKKGDSIKLITSSKSKVNLKTRLSKWVRSNFFIPDARIGWRKHAIRKAKEIIEREKIDAIFTSSPPHSVQLIGSGLKKELGIPWVADFRDPWLDAFWEKDFKKNALSLKYAEHQESITIKAADRIAITTPSFKKLFEHKFDLNNIGVVYNGYDEADFEGKSKEENKQFRIVYTGSIASSQNPINLWEAIKGLSPELRSKLQVRLFGKLDQDVLESIRTSEIEDVILIGGYIAHSEVIDEMINADLLVLLIPEGRSDIIPGKLFEYLGSKNTILCLGPKGDAAQIIENCKAGSSFDFEESLSTYIQDKLVEKSLNKKDEIHHLNIENFSRENQTKKLATILDSLNTKR